MFVFFFLLVSGVGCVIRLCRILAFHPISKFGLDFLFGFRQNYFTHFEPSQLLGGAKTGDSREKPPDYPQAEIGLSHM